MPRKKLIEEELKQEHRMVLAVMSEETALSVMDVAKRFADKYPTSELVTKWSSNVSDICRYLIVRYITFLRNKGYVEVDKGEPKMWRKVREGSLLKEVIDGYIFQGRAVNTEEAIRKLAQEHVSGKRDVFDEYVKIIRKAKRSFLREKQIREQAERNAQQILERIATPGS